MQPLHAKVKLLVVLSVFLGELESDLRSLYSISQVFNDYMDKVWGGFELRIAKIYGKILYKIQIRMISIAIWALYPATNFCLTPNVPACWYSRAKVLCLCASCAKISASVHHAPK